MAVRTLVYSILNPYIVVLDSNYKILVYGTAHMLYIIINISHGELSP